MQQMEYCTVMLVFQRYYNLVLVFTVVSLIHSLICSKISNINTTRNLVGLFQPVCRDCITKRLVHVYEKQAVLRCCGLVTVH